MSTVIHRSLSGGEIAPELYARVDMSKYATALRLCRNFIIPRTGGAQNRVGTQFVGEVYSSVNPVRLIPFVISVTNSYVLELGNLTLRVIFDGLYVTNSQAGVSGPFTISGITNANPCVITANGHGFSNGQQVRISGITGTTELNGGTLVVANSTTNTFSLQFLGGAAVNSTPFSAYISGGSVDAIFELATPYAFADLPLVKYTQNYTQMILVHPSYAPRTVTLNSSGTLFSFASPGIAIADTPDVQPPTDVALSLTSGTKTFYFVTGVGLNGEESNQSLEVGTSAIPSNVTPITISWTNSNAFTYNVYQQPGGPGNPIYLIAQNVVGSYTDAALTPPIATTYPPPGNLNALVFAPEFTGDFPGCAAFFQQRAFFGASANQPESIWGSWTGHYTNFYVSFTPTDAMPLAFSMAGNRVNQIEHFVPLNTFFILTKTTEYVCQPQTGTITGTDIGLTPFSYYGSYYLQPIPIGNRFLFVQARGSIIRDFGFEYTQDNYQGNDLTLFATHLFDGYTVADWGYQQTPNSVLWVVRSDGALLSLTYIKEQQILAWCRHDFQGGVVENVTVIPEPNGDIPYFTVRRTINGRSVRYVERMLPALFTDVRDCTYMDANLTFDGRNTGSTTMTLTGGTSWSYTETLTLTASASFFKSSDVGKEIQLNDASGQQIRFLITAFSSATVVTGQPNRTVPVDLQGVTATSWAKAIQTVKGLWHLVGQQVSVFADGFVVGSPNNPNVSSVFTVNTSGEITLDRPYAVIHVGIPFVSDIETLDIDSAQSETLADKKKIVSKVTVYLNNARGMWVGNKPSASSDPTNTSLVGLDEWKARDSEGYDSPVALHMDQHDVNIQPAANRNGRVFIRQVDPLPLTICAIAPSGLYAVGGQ